MKDEDITALLVEHADEDGNIPDDVMAKILSGEITASEIMEKSLDSDEAEEQVEETAEADDGDAEPEPEAEVEPVVLAKDGKHTIPYSELAAAREEAKKSSDQLAVLQAKLQEQDGLLAKLQEAKQEDEATGTTEATDELITDLAEDYPNAAKFIQKLTAQLDVMAQKQQQVEAAEAARSAALTAQQAFDQEVSDLQPEYFTIKETPEFWAWFDQQPRLIQLAERSGDPQAVADVISAYLATAGSSEIDQPVPPKIDTKKAAEAIARAKAKPAVTSLSDIPGGTNPAHDEVDALKNMDAFEMAGKFSGMSQAQVEAMLGRML